MLKIMARSGYEDGENEIFRTNEHESKKLNGADILDGFNYNINLDIRLQEIHDINVSYHPVFYFRTG